MSKLQDLSATRQALRELARIVKTTRQTLLAIVSRQDQLNRYGRLSPSQKPSLSNTLEHIEEVREGFIISHRTDMATKMSELRDMVNHVLLDWNWLAEFDLDVSPSDELVLLDQQLLFFNHALVALGLVPRLPPRAVTFPQRRPTYADVSAPAAPGELLQRIEEIERIIYQAEVMPAKKFEPAPLRRTYAFFEASGWLVDQHLRPLL
ncbi:hypothetical protein QUF63_12130 [Anaerolineales bacterium HSG25]|nr:hypothetical protein [Anaerolineales bacterium HSG25]